MTGKYQRKDGTIFDVIYSHKDGLQRANEGKIGHNRLFVPVTEEELKAELDRKEIEKIDGTK
jgi:hypothetical protein